MHIFFSFCLCFILITWFSCLKLVWIYFSVFFFFICRNEFTLLTNLSFNWLLHNQVLYFIFFFFCLFFVYPVHVSFCSLTVDFYKKKREKIIGLTWNATSRLDLKRLKLQRSEQFAICGKKKKKEKKPSELIVCSGFVSAPFITSAIFKFQLIFI